MGDVGRILSVKGLLNGVELILLGPEEVEESNDGSLKLGALLSTNGDGREGLPEDDFADVGCDEERDARAKTVAFLEKFVEEDHNDTGHGELHKDCNGVKVPDFFNWTVHAREEIGECLTHCDNDSKQFLGGLEKLPVILRCHVDINDLGSSKELHDHGRGDDG